MHDPHIPGWSRGSEMNIPKYSVVYSSNPLTSSEKYVMLTTCLDHVEGGYIEYYDERKTSNCKGGSSTTSDVRRSRKAALAHKGDARVSRIECVASQTGVRGRVSRQASEHKSTEHTNRIIEANLFGLPGNSMVSSYHCRDGRRPTIDALSPFAIIAHSQMTGGSSQLFLRKRDAA